MNTKISYYICYFITFLSGFTCTRDTDPNTLFNKASYQKAIKAYTKLIQTSQVNLAQCLIAQGLDTNNNNLWEQAWPLFEQRIPLEISLGKRKPLQNPLTNGYQLQNKTIKVIAEYGLGDLLTFVRYLDLAKKLGAKKTILQISSRTRLFVGDILLRSPGIDQIVTSDEKVYFDYDIYLMSLPGLISTDGYSPTTPNSVYNTNNPYIIAHTERIDIWRHKMKPNKINIAICWCASTQPVAGGTRYIDRDIPLKTLLDTLISIENVHIYCIQAPPHIAIKESQIKTMNECDPKDIIPDAYFDHMTIVNDHHGTFENMVAVLELCDAFVGVDTSRPNLAGAMGKKTFFLLKKENVDMRWGTQSNKTPWFPSAELLRQEVEDDWDPVMTTLKSRLATIKK